MSRHVTLERSDFFKSTIKHQNQYPKNQAIIKDRVGSRI